MPSTSKGQQNFFKLVNAVQQGGLKPSEVTAPVKIAAKNISEKAVKEFLVLKEKK